MRGWLDLGAIANSGGGASINGAVEAARWRSAYPGHPATELLAHCPGRPAAGRNAAAQARAAAAGQRPGRRLRRHDPRRLRLRLAAAARPTRAPQVQVYDTGVLTVDEALRQAHGDGNDFIVGPLTRQEVDVAASAWPGVPMLALNFLSAGRAAPYGMNQFALSPEDEAREVARRMLASGQKRGVALSPTGDWGTRVLAAFTQELHAGGGDAAGTGGATTRPSTTTPHRSVRCWAPIRASRRRHAAPGRCSARNSSSNRAAAPTSISSSRRRRPGRRGCCARSCASSTPATCRSTPPAMPTPTDGGVANQDLDGLIIPAMPWVVPNSGAASAVRAQRGGRIRRHHRLAVRPVCLRLRRLPARAWQSRRRAATATRCMSQG